MARMTVGVTSTGKRQIRRLRKDASWSDPRKREEFLGHLEMSCNVRASARAAGLSVAGGYAQRRSDGPFRMAWDAALEEGKVRLWEALMAHAKEAIEPSPPPEGSDEPAPPTDPSHALNLLRFHNADAARRNGRPAERKVRLSADELRVVIFEKLSGKNKELGGDG